MRSPTVRQPENHIERDESKWIAFSKYFLVILLVYECMKDIHSLSHTHHSPEGSSAEIFDATLHFVAALFLLPHRLYEIFSHHTRAAFTTALTITAVGLFVNYLFLPWMVATAILVTAICTFFFKKLWVYTRFVLLPVLFFDFIFGLIFVYYLFTPTPKG